MTDNVDTAHPRKRLRISRACDFCHRRGIKCSQSDGQDLCRACIEYGIDCTYDRPKRRRGPPPARPATSLSVSDSSNDRQSSPAHVLWIAPTIADPDTIRGLVGSYYSIVYPIFPFFHWPSFVDRVERQVYRSNRAFFVTVMAMCALVSARIRDGAPPAFLNPEEISRINLLDTPSEVYCTAAEEAIPQDLGQFDGNSFEYARALGLLAIIGIQYGQPKLSRRFLGHYCTINAMEGMHDEGRWPKDIDTIETEERRRLFWSIYTLQVYSAIVWGGIIQSREAQSVVAYPTEVDDEYITGTRANVRDQPGDRISCFRGWNHTTDLYRLLEHALDQFRRRKIGGPSNPSPFAISTYDVSPSTILDLVETMNSSLPSRFKETKEITYDPKEDRLSFQAANIMITTQTVRMVAMGSEEEFNMDQRCRIAGELLEALSGVPSAFLRAISSPLLHHLAGIGLILGRAVQGPLSQTSFLGVRNVLLSLADLLAGLESGLSFAAGTSERLRKHVERIDKCMAPGGAQSRRASVAPERSGEGAPNLDVNLGTIEVASQPSLANENVPGPGFGSLFSEETAFEFHLADDLLQAWPFDLNQATLFPEFLDDWAGSTRHESGLP